MEWNQKTFKNRIIRTIWNALPGMIMWCIWKEKNGRIFRDKLSSPDRVWQMVRENILSTIRSMQWHDEDKFIPADEIHVGEFWGLDKSQLDGLHKRDRILHPSSPKLWSPPPRLVFKLKFDGASRGNPGAAGYGGLCKNSQGRIIFIFMGTIGRDTNNPVALEGILQGLNCLVRSNNFLAIIEGDSSIMIRMARRFSIWPSQRPSVHQLEASQPLG